MTRWLLAAWLLAVGANAFVRLRLEYWRWQLRRQQRRRVLLDADLIVQNEYNRILRQQIAEMLGLPNPPPPSEEDD